MSAQIIDYVAAKEKENEAVLQQYVIEVLSDFTDVAASGQLCGLVCVGVDKDGNVMTGRAYQKNQYALIGGIEALKAKISSEIAEGME